MSHKLTNFHSGVKLALFATLMHTVVGIGCKLIAHFEFHPLLFTCYTLMYAGIGLLIFTGSEPHAKKIIKSFSTWVFGLSLVLVAACFIALLSILSATEGSMAIRLTIVFTLMVSFFIFKRKTVIKGFLGIPFILIGFIMVFSSIESEQFNYALLLTFFMCVLQTVQYYSLEHVKKVAGNITGHTDLGTMGYALTVTAGAAVVCIVIAVVSSSLAGVELVLIPTLEQVLDSNLLMVAPFFGLFGFALLRLAEYKAIKKLNADVFLLFTSLVPLLTLFLEVLIEKVTGLHLIQDINTNLFVANILVVVGSMITAYMQSPKHSELTRKERKSLLEARRVISTTLVFYKNNKKKAANSLGLTERQYDKYMEKDISVPEHMLAMIKDNFSFNVGMTDPLTGLMNRTMYEKSLQEAGSHKGEVTVLFIDLNKFKPINDTHGHDAGDAVLKAVTERIKHFLPKSAHFTRSGGDEFSIILFDYTKNEIESFVESIKTAIIQPIEFNNNMLTVGASIGYATSSENGSCAHTLYKIADQRMYEDKGDSSR